jgi:hypothetical protein
MNNHIVMLDKWDLMAYFDFSKVSQPMMNLAFVGYTKVVAVRNAVIPIKL